jgi:hypothetical protein
MKTNGVFSMTDHVELLPDPERIMEGLRDTGYTFYTAMADIIDNSISAHATKINIQVLLDPELNIIVSIADNGIGMDQASLENAMRYGSLRREEKGSLGKFGLGLKTASTAFCRCLSLVSRTKNDDEVRKVQWDLDYIAQKNAWHLKKLLPSDDDIESLDLAALGGAGTLVLWEKTDRLLRSYNTEDHTQNALKRTMQNALNKIIDSLEFHISMVYQRFLDANDKRVHTISITLNEKTVSAWDPFCTDEPDTEKLVEDTADVKMEGGKVSSFLIRAFMIPRREAFSSPEAQKKARLSNDYQGFYVYRENRLIHFGEWLGMFSNEPHGSLLRVEFSFDHTLDDAFNIDIKKSRIMLNEDISNYIKDQIMPAPRRAAEERYRKGSAKQVGKRGKDAHDSSNQNIDEKATGVEASRIEITNADKNEVKVTNQHGTFNHRITIRSASKPGQYRVIPVENIDDGMLWRPCVTEGKHAVEINQSHPYYQKIYFPVLEQNVMVTGMDSLLWALAEAELSTFNDETRYHYEDMRIQVSKFLKRLIADLPDPDTDTNG